MNNNQFWAVTCYFNPSGYRTKRENYRVFRRNLEIPLVTVELVYGDRPELGRDDADILIPLRGGDVLWQKERMLNLAIQALPTECRKVAWLDCDVVFERRDWHLKAAAELERVQLVQPFQFRVDAGRNVPIKSVDWSKTQNHSAAFRIQSGSMTRELLVNTTGPFDLWKCATGLAWAGRKEILLEHGFYDARILGGGDRAMTCASWGMMDGFPPREQMNAAQREHYLAWANGFYSAVQGQIAYVEGSVLHLWHGERAFRGYNVRYNRLLPFNFDPGQDIALSENGLWKWNSNKPEMHRLVADYFQSRNEDGA